MSSKCNTHNIAIKLFFYSTYSKTNKISRNRKRICRFLDEADTIFLLLDFFFLRPFVAVLTHNLEEEFDNVYLFYLFVKNGQKLNSLQIRTIFASTDHRLSRFNILGIWQNTFH